MWRYKKWPKYKSIFITSCRIGLYYVLIHIRYTTLLKCKTISYLWVFIFIFVPIFRCLKFIILYEDKDCGNRYCDWWVFRVQNEMIKLCNGHIFVCPSNHSIIISCLTMTRVNKTDLFKLFFYFRIIGKRF